MGESPRLYVWREVKGGENGRQTDYSPTLIFGRNLWQRPWPKAITLTDKIKTILQEYRRPLPFQESRNEALKRTPNGGNEMPAKISIDRNKCVGAGACAAIAPEVFQLDDEDKSVVIDPEGAAIEDVKEAAERCPAGAITVEEV
jgi:ferredoxin